MTSHRRTTSNAHEWTIFEKHTLLCLLAKGIHLGEGGKRNDEPGAMRRHAYLNVATELNKAVNGVSDFGNDIDKKEVAKMIDRMLVEKKGVVGKGGYLERATRGRITRGLKKMWEREPSFDYDGSLSEWKQWRKESEEERKRVKEGREPKEGGTGEVMESVEKDAKIMGDIWRQAGAGAAASNCSAPLNDPTPVIARTSAMPDTGTHASLNCLPPNLRANKEYAWANPTNSARSRSSHLSDSYRSSGRSSAGQSSQLSNRYEPPLIDTYRPPVKRTVESHRPSHPSHSQSQSSIRVERFDQPKEPASTASLTYDYSSSPMKVSSYSGATRPSNNPYKEAHIRRQVHHEVSQRKSSEFKQPGILKRRVGDNIMEEVGGGTIGDKMNVERQAMLGERDANVEMGEVEDSEMSRGRGRERTMANEEVLPFNRLDRMRE